MLTILICKPFHIKWLTQECEWINISVTTFSQFFSFVAVVLSRKVSRDYCIISRYALAMKSLWAEWGNTGY